MPHVLVAGRIDPAGIALLESAGFSVQTTDGMTTESYAPHLCDADALMIRTQPLTVREIEAAPRLKIVSRHGVGYDAVDVAALTARRIPLTIVGDVNAVAVAEQTFAMMLALAKQIREHHAATRDHDWAYRNRFAATELNGKTLLIVGFGRIGRLVAGFAKAFGMRILVADPYQSPEVVHAAGGESVDAIEAGLPEADYVTLHLPKGGNRALIGVEELQLMKRGARLLNTARGGLVDEAALFDALESGHVGGVALDVFETEPPASDTPLLHHERVLLSPHIAGISAESATRMAEAAARNIIDHFADRLDPALVVNGV